MQNNPKGTKAAAAKAARPGKRSWISTALGLGGTFQVLLLMVVLAVLIYLIVVSRNITRPLVGMKRSAASLAAAAAAAAAASSTTTTTDGSSDTTDAAAVATGKAISAIYGLPAFSAPQVHFDPYPRKIVIENEFDCNAQSLRKCAMDDPRTLFGCRELHVSCHHFDQETTHYENGLPNKIPPNITPNEGYALAIPITAEACNPYHGDLALVTLSASSRQYILLCRCKNPGYVGKNTLLGDCSVPTICGGKVVSLDQELRELECDCKPHERSMRYTDGLPSCKTLLVHEANARFDDWTNLLAWDNDRTLPTRYFSVTIAEGVKTRVLLDPCRNALTDPRIEIPNGRYDAGHGQCFLTDHGFPLVLDLLKVRTEQKPDKGEIAPIFVSAVLPTSAYRRIRISGGISGKGRFFAIVTRGIQFGALGRHDLESGTITLVPDGKIAVGGPHSRGAVSINPRPRSFWSSRCDERAFGYSCLVRENYGYTLPSGLTFPSVKPPPALYLWGTQEWVTAESRVKDSFKEGAYSVVVRAGAFEENPQLQGYGLQWCAYHDPEPSGIVMFERYDDYQLHKQAISEPQAEDTPAEKAPQPVTPTSRKSRTTVTT
jgi:Per os infectivity